SCSVSARACLTSGGPPFVHRQRRHDARGSGSEAMNVQAVDVGGDVHPSKYDRLIAMAKAIPSAATLVVHPCDESSLRGVVAATDAGLIEPTLVGPAVKIKSAAAKHDID